MIAARNQIAGAQRRERARNRGGIIERFRGLANLAKIRQRCKAAWLF